MALIIVIHNDKTGPDDAANYDVTVYVNHRIIERARIEGHNRQDDWRTLLARLIGADQVQARLTQREFDVMTFCSIVGVEAEEQLEDKLKALAKHAKMPFYRMPGCNLKHAPDESCNLACGDF